MERKPLSHLINIIHSTTNHHPKFALFLGAGASAESGVKTGSQMIKDWRQMMFDMYREKEETIDEFLKRQNWYMSVDEYSYLFEKLFDEPSQRREYIETCIGDSYPSWGYIYLVNLIKNNVFNTIFTTNFDDLLNEACYAFSSNIRPVVCAHDSSIKSLRITSKRPKIIKLHGDFLFDNLKNTVRELETLETNMLEKFKQYASEYGFIVVGYSGQDRSIMDALNLLLKSDSNFPHGIYWCIKKGEKINDSVDRLSKFTKVKLIEIEGFDELFADINSRLNIQLQPEMVDPYLALTEKLNTLLNKIKLKDDEINPVIQKDIKNLAEKIENTSNIKVDHDDICLKIDNKTTVKLPIPYILLADVSDRSKNHDVAAKYIEKELEKGVNLDNFPMAIKIYSKVNNTDKLNFIINEIESKPTILQDKPESVFDSFLILLNEKRYDLAERLINAAYKYGIENSVINLSEYFLLNILQIKAHKEESYLESEIHCLENIANSSKDEYAVLGANILLKNFSKSETILNDIKKIKSIKNLASWPIINLLKPHLIDNSVFL